jgi:hypothetical protein
MCCVGRKKVTGKKVTIKFAGNYAIGNIQVCYADALPVSIVERS